jgi:hypothetical protein
MKLNSKLLIILTLGLMAFSLSANAERITVPKGTDVILAFDQDLSSKTAKVGDVIFLHVANDVRVGGHTILEAGTKVTGTISQVDKRKRYGINAEMRIVLNPVKSTYGRMIELNARREGKLVGGKKSDEAAGATVGGAILLGPVGLIGGFFVHGKPVEIRAGDQLATEVSKAVRLHRE